MTTTAPHRLVGSWRLRDWVSADDAGATSHPMGSSPEGVLVYSPDGTMVALMGPAGRERFGSDDLTGGSPDEQARAFRTFVAYGGGYEVDGPVVRHRVEHSLFPNWVGTVQERSWTLDEASSVLTLTSPPIALGGTTRVQRLTWERIAR